MSLEEEVPTLLPSDLHWVLSMTSKSLKHFSDRREIPDLDIPHAQCAITYNNSILHTSLVRHARLTVQALMQKQQCNAFDPI